MPPGYISAGFFFPMDTRQELNELSIIFQEDIQSYIYALVRYGGEFRICEYLKTKNHGDYILEEAECKKTS